MTGPDDVAPAVRLRRVEDGDLDVLFEHESDPEAAAMAAFPSRDKDRFAAHWAKVRADEANLVRTIVVDGAVAGMLVDEVSVRPLHACVAAHNIGSIRVLEKCGFRRDLSQEANVPAPEDGIEELAFVLDA